MAAKHGWKYEELPGTDALLRQLLQARDSNDEVLVVPPHHVTVYDPLNRGLRAVPFWEGESAPTERRHTLVFQSGNGGAEGKRQAARLGRPPAAPGQQRVERTADTDNDRFVERRHEVSVRAADRNPPRARSVPQSPGTSIRPTATRIRRSCSDSEERGGATAPRPAPVGRGFRPPTCRARPAPRSRRGTGRRAGAGTRTPRASRGQWETTPARARGGLEQPPT